MKRWNVKLKKEIENTKIDKFLKEISSLCKKYDFSISHEDGHGAFLIIKRDENYEKWLLGAHDSTNS